MPVIVFASPKGGAGKSTSSLILATELSARGAAVAVIDADPNRPLVRWSHLPNKPDGVRVIGDVTEDTIIDLIEAEAGRTSFVIVDLEGTRSRLVPYAMSRADLVVVPTRGSDLDAVEAGGAIREVRAQEKAFRQRIPVAVLFTCTSPALRPRTLANIEQQLASNGVDVFGVRIHERDAFRALFSYGGGLRSLDPAAVRNIPAAIENGRAFAQEVIDRLRAARTAEVVA